MFDIKVGDIVNFDNGLVRGKATVTQISEKAVFEKINGERTRYILDLNGTVHICSPSEVISVEEPENEKEFE